MDSKQVVHRPGGTGNPDWSNIMAKITKEYSNTANGGKERVSRDGDSYYIESCHPNHSIGWMGERKISRLEAERCMAYTNAPSYVVDEILKND